MELSVQAFDQVCDETIVELILVLVDNSVWASVEETVILPGSQLGQPPSLGNGEICRGVQAPEMYTVPLLLLGVLEVVRQRDQDPLDELNLVYASQ